MLVVEILNLNQTLNKSFMKKITLLVAVLATTLSFGQTNLFTDGDLTGKTSDDIKKRDDFSIPSATTAGVWYQNSSASKQDAVKGDNVPFTVVDDQINRVAGFYSKVNGLGQNVNVAAVGVYTFSVDVTLSTDAVVGTKDSNGETVNNKLQFNFFKDDVTDATKKVAGIFASEAGSYSGTGISPDVAAGSVTFDIYFDTAGYYGFKFNAVRELLTAGSISFDNFSLEFNADKTNNLSIADNVIEGLKVYPNPASDLVSISAPYGVDSVAVLNALGQKVTAPFNAGNAVLNVSNLSRGIYILLVNSMGVTAAQKIVVE